MQLKLTNVLLAGALAVTSVSATFADVVVENIEKITDISADATDILLEIKSPGDVFAQIPKAITTFGDIISTVTSSITMLTEAEGTEKIDSDDVQQEICDAFTGFVRVHIDLLDTVIGKKSLVAGTPFTAPIAGVLRLVEEGVDGLAFSLIGFVPSCEDEAMEEKEKLSLKLEESIEAYTGGSDSEDGSSSGGLFGLGGNSGSEGGSESMSEGGSESMSEGSSSSGGLFNFGGNSDSEGSADSDSKPGSEGSPSFQGGFNFGGKSNSESKVAS